MRAAAAATATAAAMMTMVGRRRWDGSGGGGNGDGSGAPRTPDSVRVVVEGDERVLIGPAFPSRYSVAHAGRP